MSLACEECGEDVFLGESRRYAFLSERGRAMGSRWRAVCDGCGAVYFGAGPSPEDGWKLMPGAGLKVTGSEQMLKAAPRDEKSGMEIWRHTLEADGWVCQIQVQWTDDLPEVAFQQKDQTALAFLQDRGAKAARQAIERFGLNQGLLVSGELVQGSPLILAYPLQGEPIGYQSEGVWKACDYDVRVGTPPS